MSDKVDFKGVKLLSIGDYKNDRNGNPTVKVTNEVLDGIVEAYKDFENNTLPDLIFDHKESKEERDNQYKVLDPQGKEKKLFGRMPFVLGKIKNITKSGNSIYGDIINVFEPIKKALKEKLYTSLSPEFFLDIKSNVTGKTYAGALTAVAILPGGTWAEQFDKFQPYMFSIENSTYSEPLKFEATEFDSDNKILCKLISKEEITMTEKEYQKKMMPMIAKGMKCASYQDFEAMDSDKQAEYLAKMESKYNKFSNDFEYGEIEKMSTPNKPETTQTELNKFSMEDLYKRFDAQDTENKELKKQLFSLVNKTDEKVNEENKLLKEQIEAINRSEKRKDVIKFVNDKLIDSNKFDPADREKLENGLTAIAMLSNNKIKFSFNSADIEVSPLEFVSEMLEKAQAKTTFSHTQIVKGGDGITVTQKEVIESGGASADDILQDKKIKFKHQELDFSKMTESEMLKVYEKEGVIS